MTNPRLAGRYAKSLIDLAIEQNQLNEVYADIKFLQTICISNQDFVNVLKSPVIKSDIKEKIIEAVTQNKVTKTTDLFLKLLVIKAREYNLPEIVKAFVEQYNSINNIHQVKLTTAVSISKELEQSIVNKIKLVAKIEKIELETAVEDDLIGGFTLQMGDTFIDASILRDLNDVKKHFKNNQYVHALK
jgi:F-type H+-transporting ATPase subunit delta